MIENKKCPKCGSVEIDFEKIEAPEWWYKEG